MDKLPKEGPSWGAGKGLWNSTSHALFEFGRPQAGPEVCHYRAVEPFLMDLVEQGHWGGALQKGVLTVSAHPGKPACPVQSKSGNPESNFCVF